MTRLKCIVLFGLLHLSTSTLLFAQDTKEAKADVAFLNRNASDLAKSMKKVRQRAFDIAKKKGWPTFQITRTGKIIQLVGIDDAGLPLYDATENETAAGTTRANKLYAGGGLGLNLNGSTIPNNKVAVWDGGSILTTHREFAGGRIAVMDASSTSSHGTHVGGTIAASGVYATAKGMAYCLPQLLSYDFNNDNSEMSANAANLLLSNHSYGVVAGWVRNSDEGNRWEFRGRWGENEDYKFGYYDTKARDWDNICFNAPYYLPVKSAGNYRSENGPSVGQPYFRYNASGSMIDAGNRPAGMSSNDGYGIVANYGTAKNILTVGAVNGLQYGATSPSDVVYSSFTAWGPTDDGRIKPDLVADGVGMTSTNNTGNDHYYTSSGTSMAAPNATGTLVLLQELYYQNNGAYMLSATLKGLSIATTSEAGANPGPDYQFGWGLLNAEKAAKAILDNNNKSLISERNLNQGQTQTVNVIASGNGPLVATICWTDRAGTVISSSSASALNNPTLRLVNDLDMRISDGTSTFSPWILDPANPSFAATTGDNFRDNVEQIYIANAVPGKSYSITINHKGTLTGGSQFFSLIVTGVGGNVYCTSSPSSNADSKITNFQLANINHNPATTCTTYGDYTNQTIELERSKNYNLSLTVGSCGGDQNKIAKVFVDWNGDGDFDDSNELAATSSVIAATGTFNTSISVPGNVAVGNFTRLRIVLSETSDAANVLACGSYSKGETQDYRVKFNEAAINVGISEIVTPVSGDAAGLNRKLTLKLKNYGTNPVSLVPIVVVVKDGPTSIATINETYNGSLSSGAEVTFLVQGSFNTQSGKTYTIEAATNLPTDLVVADNLATKNVSFAASPTINTTQAYFTDAAGTYYLHATQNDGRLFWYNDVNSSTAFYNGNSVVTSVAPLAGNTFYATLNSYTNSFVPANKAAFSTVGTYVQPTFRLYFDAAAPMIIETARLHIGYRGAVTFNVFDNVSGVKVSSSTVSVSNTRNPASAAVGAANDATDIGQLYNVDIRFPYAGSFYLTAEFNNGATLFRNNNTNGTFTYPMTDSQNLLSLTSHNGNSTTPNSFFYYIYGINAKPIGETVNTKVAVPIANLAVTREGDLLTSPIANGNQWYLNGNPISGATSATCQATTVGSYVVKVTVAGGVTITSQPLVVNTLPVKLNNFTATKHANGVHLKWTTLSEINHKHFVVERSIDGNTFNEIGIVEPNTNKQYAFVDKTPSWGINYYRIVQVDRDGNTETFGPKAINYDVAAEIDVQVYANPVKTNFTVKANHVQLNETYAVIIFDVLGRKVKELNIAGKELLTGKNIDIAGLISGNYVLEINGARKVGQAKFIKL